MANKFNYNMESDTRTIIAYEGRPSVKVNGVVYIGKARKSRMQLGEEVTVFYRHTRQGNSVTVSSERKGIEDERWISAAAYFGE